MPFVIDLNAKLRRWRALLNDKATGVKISLPGISFTFKTAETERVVAREVLIRLGDKRVLNSRECCSDCIEHAFASLEKIRSLLVDKQVELAELREGPLFMLLEMMLEGIRQFFTYWDRSGLSRVSERELLGMYPEGLDILRGHLHNCLTQISLIAEMEFRPERPEFRHEQWHLKHYTPLAVEVPTS